MAVFDVACGDVLLISGRTAMHLRSAEITGCNWTQLAMVYCDAGTSQPLVFQATMFPSCPDVRRGLIFQGVQLVPLANLLRSFDSGVAVRKLRPSLSIEQLAKLTAFIDQVYGRPFCCSKKVSVGALHRRNKPSDGASFFCSELVAEAYQRLELLPSPPEGRSSNNFIPADFCNTYSNALLPLRAGITLSEEQLLATDEAQAIVQFREAVGS
jgi:hypothetical protein